MIRAEFPIFYSSAQPTGLFSEQTGIRTTDPEIADRPSGLGVRSSPPAPLPDNEAATPFCSILFPPGLEGERVDQTGQPECLVDLNLDQVIGEIVAKHDADVLTPIFHSTYRNESIIHYRQAVFADLERIEVFQAFPVFREGMRTVRANLAYAGKILYSRHRDMVVLRAIMVYCETVGALRNALAASPLQSAGLKDLQRYLTRYTSSEDFTQLANEARRLREILSRLSYGMLFRGDRVTVRKYASEPDYTVTIRERFSRFRKTNGKSPGSHQARDDFGLNHIEEGILEFVGRLFPKEFRALEEYVAQHPAFMDEVIVTFDREIGFFIGYLTFTSSLKRAGLPFCYPEVSAKTKNMEVCGSFDLALAATLLKESQTVVCNDFFLRAPERLIVVSGPNQGGKTTFARMVGQLHFLAGLGCPVPGKHARLFLPDRIFTHFEREEDITNLRGKLEDELVRLHQTCQAMTSNSVIVLNEIFNSTSLEDQVVLSTNVLQQILASDAISVCVTFIDGLSRLGEKTVSMMSTVMPDDPAIRTFTIIRKPADGLAYALSLAQKRGVTYEQLRTRVQP